MLIRIRKHDIEPGNELVEFVERRIHFSLGRFGGRLRSAVVSLRDVNGPRGGIDQECRVTVRFVRGGTVAITERDTEIFAAVARAVDRTGRTVSRRIGLEGVR